MTRKKLGLLLVVFFILLASLIVRIYLFPSNNTWVGDIGRDFLAGHLIAFEGAKTTHGHFNSGMGFSVYPSSYYYFISILTIAADDKFQQIIVFLIIYQVAGIAMLFIILKQIFSSTTTLLATILYAFSSFGINLSMYPISAYNSVPISLMAALILQTACKKNSSSYFIISGLLFSLAATFFYGVILLIPFLFFAINIYFWQKGEKYSNQIIKSAYFIFFFLLGLIGMFAPTAEFSKITDVLLWSGINQIQTINLNWPSLANQLDENFKNLHPILTSWFYILYLFSLVFLIKIKKWRNYLFLIVFFIFTHIFLYAIHPNALDHYLLYVSFAPIIIMSMLLETTKSINFWLFCCIGALVMYGIGTWHIERHNHNDENYQTYLEIHSIVQEYFPQHNIINWGNCQSKLYGQKSWQYDNKLWESRSYWYLNRKQKSFLLDDVHHQIELTDSKVVYLCYFDDDQKYRDEPTLEFKIKNRTYFLYI